MSERIENTPKSKIPCLEVLIPKTFIESSNGKSLRWTLSVYSLENQPVKKNRAITHSEIFHFMEYDWKRTIKELLEQHQVPYSIIQYFCPDTIHADSSLQHHELTDQETDYLAAVNELEEVAIRNTRPFSQRRQGYADMFA